MTKRLIFWLGFAVVLWMAMGLLRPTPKQIPPARQAVRSPAAPERWRPRATRPSPAPNVRAPERALPPEPAREPVELPKEEKVEGDIFAHPGVLRIRIEIPEAGLEALRRSGWRYGQERPTVQATVREGGALYTNVAVHLKGSMGSFRPLDVNPGLTLNFSKFAKGQTFHGLRKLSLNNSVQDRTYLTEKLCREMFEAAGVPVPRATHATLTLNGRYFGLRVLVEGYDKHFLKRYFKNTDGNLYDGGFCQDVNAHLAVNSGERPDDRSDLATLRAAAREPNPGRRWERLNRVLDMERFLSFLAMEDLLAHWDGYAGNRNNWRLYHDLDRDKLVFMPHGLDQMFGVKRANPDYPILPGVQGWIARAVLEVPEGRRQYLERLAHLLDSVFPLEPTQERVRALAAALRPVLAAGSPQAAARHDEAVRALLRRMAARHESLQSQLRELGVASGV